MKKKILAVIAALSLVLLCACGQMLEAAADTEVERLMLEAFDALEAGDADAFYALFAPEVLPEDDAEYAALFAGVRDYYKGTVVDYKLTSISKKSHASGGGTTLNVEANYTVTTSQDTYYTYVARLEDPNTSGLTGFNIVTQADYETAEEESTPTGTLDTLGSFTLEQWMTFFLSLIVYGFTIFTLVRCLRDRIRLKPLFVIVVLAQFALTFTMSADIGVQFSFMLRFLSMSRLLLYPGGGMVLTLTLPAGAIVYWFIRKSLKKPEPPPPAYYPPPYYPQGPQPPQGPPPQQFQQGPPQQFQPPPPQQPPQEETEENREV